MIKTLLAQVKEFKKASFLTGIYDTGGCGGDNDSSCNGRYDRQRCGSR